MIDKDGKSEYSKIVSIANKDYNSIAITNIYLSAGTNTASLLVNSSKMQEANLSITDISGRTVLNSRIQLQKGNNSINKNIPALSKDIYYVKLFTADEIAVKNVFVRN